MRFALFLIASTLSADLIRVAPFDHSVFFPDSLTYQNYGISEACVLWPEICELENIGAFDDIARPQAGECVPFMVRGQGNLYLYACPAPVIEAIDDRLACLDCGGVTPVPEPGYFVAVGLIMLGAVLIMSLRRW